MSRRDRRSLDSPGWLSVSATDPPCTPGMPTTVLKPLRTIGLVCLVVCAALSWSCVEAGPPRHMRALIQGVSCDPEQSTLVGQRDDRADRAAPGLVKLYLTRGGHFFIESRTGHDTTITLISREEAMRFYDATVQRRFNMPSEPPD